MNAYLVELLPFNSNEKIDKLMNLVVEHKLDISHSFEVEILLNIKKLKTQLYFKEKLGEYKKKMTIESDKRQSQLEAEAFLIEQDKKLLNYKNPNKKINTKQIKERSSNPYDSSTRSTLKGIKYYPSKS